MRRLRKALDERIDVHLEVSLGWLVGVACLLVSHLLRDFGYGQPWTTVRGALVTVAVVLMVRIIWRSLRD